MTKKLHLLRGSRLKEDLAAPIMSEEIWTQEGDSQKPLHLPASNILKSVSYTKVCAFYLPFWGEETPVD